MKKIIILLFISLLIFGCIQEEKTIQVVDDTDQETVDSDIVKNESLKLYKFGKFNKGDGFLLEGTPIVLESVGTDKVTLKVGTESVDATLTEGSAYFSLNDKDAYKITVDSINDDTAVLAAAKFQVPRLNQAVQKVTVRSTDYPVCGEAKVGCCKESAESNIVACWAPRLPARYRVTSEKCFDGTEYNQCSKSSKGYICYGSQQEPQLIPACEECGCSDNEVCESDGICVLEDSAEIPPIDACSLNTCNTDGQACTFDYATSQNAWVSCLTDEVCETGLGCINSNENRSPRSVPEDKLEVSASSKGAVKIDVTTTDPDGDDLQYLLFDQSGYSASNVSMPYDFVLDYRDQTREGRTILKSFNIIDNQGGSTNATVYIDIIPPKYLDCKEIEKGYCYCNYGKEYLINDSKLQFTGFVPVPGEPGSSTQSFEYSINDVKTTGTREEVKIGVFGGGSLYPKMDEVVELQIGDEYYVAHLLDEGFDLFKGNLEHVKDNSNWWVSCLVTIEDIARDKCNNRTFEERDFKYYVCGDYVREVSSVEGVGATYTDLAGKQVLCPVLEDSLLSDSCKDLLSQDLTCEEFC